MIRLFVFLAALILYLMPPVAQAFAASHVRPPGAALVHPISTDTELTRGAGPTTGSMDLAAWLYKWQTLLAGALSAVAVATVTLFVWRYEVWHLRKQGVQDTHRLAKSLSREIETIVERILAAKKLFEIAVDLNRSFLMPDISRPFPVYSNHTRDLALFDDDTAKHLMMFYEGLPAYTELRAYFREHSALPKRLDVTSSLPTQEQSFVLFSQRAVPLGEQLRLRLDAIAEDREPPLWQDDWIQP